MQSSDICFRSRPLITPNIFEAARLSDQAIAEDLEALRRTAMALHKLDAKAVLVKGGHVAGPTSDDLFFEAESFRLFSAPRIKTRNTHGTGCTLSSAVAAYLARGDGFPEAINAAKTYLNGALAAADSLSRPRTRAAKSFPRILEALSPRWRFPNRIICYKGGGKLGVPPHMRACR